MFTLLALFLTIALFGVLGHFFGADTRDGRDWTPSDHPTPPDLTWRDERTPETTPARSDQPAPARGPRHTMAPAR
ncbi:hypothetical protein [Actinomadura flavalba]|uniref:hypothetical protein n=1 Tax=Actinomadura flavalba TaxID=1120938 RepID=UPI00035EEFDD|nr:hypothetical protein [Actinomadura flavalba]